MKMVKGSWETTGRGERARYTEIEGRPGGEMLKSGDK